MKTPRRTFLKTSITASALTALGATPSRAAAPSSQAGREYYELRAYRLPAGASPDALHGYLEKALIPALNRRGVTPIGVFAEAPSAAPSVVWVLIPYPSLEAFATITSSINFDSTVQAAGAGYLQVPRAAPAFERIDSWLLLAFAGMPKMEIPAFSQARQPRLFEMRMYESHSELKARKKVDMFNDGEIEIMRQVGLAPLFFGEALAGPNLPHLTYMTSATDAAAHREHWNAFRVHPDWVRMSADPQYADTVTKNTARILTPAAYSQI